jgi:hypothetical protein
MLRDVATIAPWKRLISSILSHFPSLFPFVRTEEIALLFHFTSLGAAIAPYHLPAGTIALLYQEF